MSQQINLFNPALLKKRDWMALPYVLTVYFVCVLAMLGSYIYQQSVLAGVHKLHQQRVQQLATLEASFRALTNTSADPAHQHAQQLALQKLTQQKMEQAQILQVMQYLQANHQQYHLLDYMQALATQQLKGVWLTGFSLDVMNKKVSVQGQALTADLIPEYIATLGAAQVFKGQTFSGLSVQSVDIHATPKDAEKNQQRTVLVPAGGETIAQAQGNRGKEQTGTAEAMTVLSFEIGGQDTSAQPVASGLAAPPAGTADAWNSAPRPMEPEGNAAEQLFSQVQDSSAQSIELGVAAAKLLKAIESGKILHE